ncbi:MAG: HK97 family phage prohead protease [Atopobiaceae bacterium]|nr:HK97 family phage prohead protease [Atopobiaceae bacterium]
MPQRNTKSVTAKAEVDGSGLITGYAATFTREPDFVGDVIAKGAFAECLRRIEAEGATLPMLYNHDQSLDSFIGRVTSIAEDDHGLLFTAEFDETESAQRARQLAMDGRLAKFSFSYLVLDEAPVELEDGRRANELRRLDIDEVSLVLSPCNPDTSVVEVKGAAQGEKAGRRNSKADEDAIRQAIALLQGVLGEEAEDDHETPGEGDQNDANDAEGTTEGGEGEATPKGREDESEDIEAYRKQALLSAYGIDTHSKEGNHA